jgi:hypothetical protein
MKNFNGAIDLTHLDLYEIYISVAKLISDHLKLDVESYIYPKYLEIEDYKKCLNFAIDFYYSNIVDRSLKNIDKSVVKEGIKVGLFSSSLSIEIAGMIDPKIKSYLIRDRMFGINMMLGFFEYITDYLYDELGTRDVDRKIDLLISSIDREVNKLVKQASRELECEDELIEFIRLYINEWIHHCSITSTIIKDLTNITKIISQTYHYITNILNIKSWHTLFLSLAIPLLYHSGSLIEILRFKNNLIKGSRLICLLDDIIDIQKDLSKGNLLNNIYIIEILKNLAERKSKQTENIIKKIIIGNVINAILTYNSIKNKMSPPIIYCLNRGLSIQIYEYMSCFYY